jgi:4-carboxymuconolactone decarboxylase
MTKSVVPWAERAGFASQTRDGRLIGRFNPALQSPVVGGSFPAHSAVARSVGLPDQVVRALAADQMPGDVATARG